MRRLLASAAVAAAFVASPVAADAGIQYSRTCGGVVDTECNGVRCPLGSLDCFPAECLVWLNPFHDAQLAVCISPVGG